MTGLVTYHSHALQTSPGVFTWRIANTEQLGSTSRCVAAHVVLAYMLQVTNSENPVRRNILKRLLYPIGAQSYSWRFYM